MKIITLLPVKNETWILPLTLKNFELFSDEIIILDDSSTDDLQSITVHYPNVRIVLYKQQEEYVDMSKRRSVLLEEGRKSEGTHFVFLDADELFCYDFAVRCREICSLMKEGDTLLLPWITVYRDNSSLVYDPQEETNYKDFIFCDDRKALFRQQFLSEPRTPGNGTKGVCIPMKEGCVLHLQHLSEKRNQLKQAWYRCNELLEGNRSARRINATYDFTKRSTLSRKSSVADHFLLKNIELVRTDGNASMYIPRLMSLFERKGLPYFEPLDIWHIEELHSLFVEKEGREPRPSVFPSWIIRANNIKNYLKNYLKSAII